LAIKAAAAAWKTEDNVDENSQIFSEERCITDRDYGDEGLTSEDFLLVGQSGDAMADGNYRGLKIDRQRLPSQNSVRGMLLAASCDVITGACGMALFHSIPSN